MFGKKNKGGQGNQNNGVNGQPNMFSSNDFSNFPTQEDFMNSNSNFNFNNENPFMTDKR